MSEYDVKKINVHYNYRINVLNNTIYIESKFDTWFIELKNNKIILYHKNKKHDRTNYHEQQKHFSTISQVFKYINKHDNNYLKPSRMDYLFEQVHNINCRNNKYYTY